MSHRTIRLTHRLIAVAAASAAAVVLSACATDDAGPAGTASPTPAGAADVAPESTAIDAALAEHGLDGLDAIGLIDTLDQLPLDERPGDFMASIRPDELLLIDADQNETALPMPEDSFYVSIAPYVDQTHDCYFHSLTTCTGELQGEELRVRVTDNATGEVLVDQTTETFANGFVGLWLPRGVEEASITIEHDGLSATSVLSTDDAEDATCVTTMQLA